MLVEETLQCLHVDIEDSILMMSILRKVIPVPTNVEEKTQHTKKMKVAVKYLQPILVLALAAFLMGR